MVKKLKINGVTILQYNPSDEKWDFFTPCGQSITETPSKKKDNIRSCDQDILDTVLQDTSMKNILVILESPHKDEYKYSDDGTFFPLSPANGSTGVNFYKYFTSNVLPVLEQKQHGRLELEQNIKYRVFFVEPVPFQTSFDRIHKEKKLPKKFKEKIWNALYSKCKADFKERVRDYNPAIILNGCTSSDESSSGFLSLKDQVTKTINEIQFYTPSELQKFEVSHPCCWNTLVYRKF